MGREEIVGEERVRIEIGERSWSGLEEGGGWIWE